MSKNKSDVNDEIFEALLGPASKEALRREMEELPSDEEIAELCPIPDTLNKRITKMIDSHEKTYKRRQKIKKFSKVVAGFTMLSAATGTILMSVEASRNFIRNSVINMSSDHLTIEFSENTIDTNNSRFTLEYMPNGFELTANQELERLYTAIYSDDIGGLIIISRHKAESATLGIDDEMREFLAAYINGQEFYIFESSDIQNKNVFVWNSNNNIFDITSTISLEEMLKIAQNLTFR